MGNVSCSVDGSAKKKRPCEPTRKKSMLTVPISPVLLCGSAGALLHAQCGHHERKGRWVFWCDSISWALGAWTFGCPPPCPQRLRRRLVSQPHDLPWKTNLSSCALVGDGDDASVGFCSADDASVVLLGRCLLRLALTIEVLPGSRQSTCTLHHFCTARIQVQMMLFCMRPCGFAILDRTPRNCQICSRRPRGLCP